MLLFLSKYHDTEMSMRSLQQRLHDMGLKRRNISYKIQEILQEIVKVPWQVVRLFVEPASKKSEHKLPAD